MVKKRRLLQISELAIMFSQKKKKKELVISNNVMSMSSWVWATRGMNSKHGIEC
jgi:hypothetical protein